MQRTVSLIKKYDQMLPEESQALFDTATTRWNNLKTKVARAKQRLGPRIQEESYRITKVTESFGTVRGDRIGSVRGPRVWEIESLVPGRVKQMTSKMYTCRFLA